MKTNFEVSADTRFLHQALDKLEVGAVIEYGALSALIGRDVQGPARYHLISAMRMLSKAGKEFGAVRGVGVKRLSSAEVVTVAETHIDRSRQAAKRGMRRLSNADYESLDNAARLRHNTTASVLGAMVLFGKPKSVAKVASAVEQAHAELPVGRVIELFKG